MTVESIDILQSEQIEDLQDDVEELETKINLAVTDITQLTTKLNSVISDLENLDGLLMGSSSSNQYTPGTPVSTDGLLKRVDELYSNFWDHIHMPPFSDALQGFVSSHPPYSPGSYALYPTHATAIPNSLATTSQSSVTSYTPTAQSVTVTGSYTPAVTKSAVVLKTVPEARARQLARKTINTVRN
jgi:hypothetical protein